MNEKGTQEKILQPKSGWVSLFGNLFLMIAFFAFAMLEILGGEEERLSPLAILALILFIVYDFIIGPILFCGLKVLRPKEALVLTLFGKYSGTIKTEGFYFVNPFSQSVNPAYQAYQKQLMSGDKNVERSTAALSKKISLKTMTHQNECQKINDELGNPIEISINVIWRIHDTAKAVFDVDNYQEFLSRQADTALRNVARLYPYDVSEHGDEKSLRASSQEVADKIKENLQEKVEVAGIEIIETRIAHLAYAPEIAAAMLQRQQAAAIIEARQKIVEGAVGMVEMALKKLNEQEICELDEERKAQMVSNLLVVLCGNKDAQPIVNSGSLY